LRLEAQAQQSANENETHQVTQDVLVVLVGFLHVPKLLTLFQEQPNQQENLFQATTQ